jgi:transcriptional regulator with XRE-family HTH domain
MQIHWTSANTASAVCEYACLHMGNLILNINRHIIYRSYQSQCNISDGLVVITAAQMKAARALLGIDQRQLADLAGVSVPTIQRMEASADVVRGNVDSLMRVLAALADSGIELINEGAVSEGGGRGVRLRTKVQRAGDGFDSRPTARRMGSAP